MNFETSESKTRSIYYDMGKHIGREQVWDAIRFATEEPDIWNGMTIAEWLERGPDAFIEHVGRYKRDQFLVGDIVRIKDSGVLFVVTAHEPGLDILPGWVCGVNASGHVECEDSDHIERTGERIETAADVLAALAEYE